MVLVDFDLSRIDGATGDIRRARFDDPVSGTTLYQFSNTNPGELLEEKAMEGISG